MPKHRASLREEGCQRHDMAKEHGGCEKRQTLTAVEYSVCEDWSVTIGHSLSLFAEYNEGSECHDRLMTKDDWLVSRHGRINLARPGIDAASQRLNVLESQALKKCGGRLAADAVMAVNDEIGVAIIPNFLGTLWQFVEGDEHTAGETCEP